MSSAKSLSILKVKTIGQRVRVMSEWCQRDVTVMSEWCQSDVRVMSVDVRVMLSEWCQLMSEWCQSDVRVMLSEWCQLMSEGCQSDGRVMSEWCQLMSEWCQSDVRMMSDVQMILFKTQLQIIIDKMISTEMLWCRLCLFTILSHCRCLRWNIDWSGDFILTNQLTAKFIGNLFCREAAPHVSC